MKRVSISRALVVSCAIAAAAAACNNGARSTMSSNSDSNGTTARSDRATTSDNDRQTPITITGCLQKAGRSFVLTRLNEPSEKSVGTSGTPAEVEREQLREARNAYRVDAKGDVKMDDMVGKQVRVSGTLADKADLPNMQDNTTTERQEKGTAGLDTRKADRTNDAKRPDIDAGDLAKIDASSVTVVSDACGGGSQNANTNSKSNSTGRKR